jgi:hypothetical protein
MMHRQDWERLQQIREQLNDLVEEAANLVRISGNKFAYERAKAYWIGAMYQSLAGGRMAGCDMDETIATLEPDEEVDEDEELPPIEN